MNKYSHIDLRVDSWEKARAKILPLFRPYPGLPAKQKKNLLLNS